MLRKICFILGCGMGIYGAFTAPLWAICFMAFIIACLYSENPWRS